MLGDLSLGVDFGYAPDYVNAAWNILQLEKPDDFIICTGETHTIREFLDEAFEVVGLKADDHVEFDPKLLRPGKTDTLVGDFSKAAKTFGYKPNVTFKQLVKILIEHDLEEEKKS